MDARIAIAAVVVLLLGETTAIYVGTHDDPEHDEARVVAELAKVEPSDAVPSDIRLPEVLRAATCAPGKPGYGPQRLHAPKCPAGGPNNHLNLTLSPTTLRVAGREVLRPPTDLADGIAPLRKSGTTILPLEEAIRFESKVLSTAGGHVDYVNLYVDASTPYAAVREVVQSLHVPSRFVVRSREGGVGFVNFRQFQAVWREYGVRVELQGAQLRLLYPGDCIRPDAGDRRIEEEAFARCLGTVDQDDRASMSLWVYGTPRFADVVAALAILDDASTEDAPEWVECGNDQDCWSTNWNKNRPDYDPRAVGVPEAGGELVLPQ